MTGLTGEELVNLMERVFGRRPEDHQLAILADLPDSSTPDNPAWHARREMAADWARLLRARAVDLGLDAVHLILYRNVGTNNGDLPAACVLHDTGPLPATADDMSGHELPFDTVLATHQILVAPTHFSATAPLKMAARAHRYRAATMPGFTPEMIPALRLDYGRIAARVRALKRLLDEAMRADFVFETPAAPARLTLDLRHRLAHESSGLLREPGMAGNLPSGEAYIVPYEGEIAGDPTGSAGELPVQFGNEIVVYEVLNNVAVRVLTQGPAAALEAEKLAAEPAYGNIAELGLGVLGELGVKPAGELLLDEKLGLHIAFGRSDHFGGQVGPARFSRPDRVVHIDWVYTESIQPMIRVAEVTLAMPSGDPVLLMRDGRYVVRFED